MNLLCACMHVCEFCMLYIAVLYMCLTVVFCISVGLSQGGRNVVY